jgi:hypothetical protein
MVTEGLQHATSFSCPPTEASAKQGHGAARFFCGGRDEQAARALTLLSHKQIYRQRSQDRKVAQRKIGMKNRVVWFSFAPYAALR